MYNKSISKSEYCRQHKDDVLAGKEVYLLRNESKKGSGFFEANNFYPDFILWILEGEKHYITFIDPKGIRNLKGLNDPKIQLFKYLQTEVAVQLGNPNLVLNSFIISNTPMQQVEFWAKEQFAAQEFTDNHVFFEHNAPGYFDTMVGMILTWKGFVGENSFHFIITYLSKKRGTTWLKRMASYHALIAYVTMN